MEDKHEGNLITMKRVLFFFLTKGCFALKGYGVSPKSEDLWDLQDLSKH